MSHKKVISWNTMCSLFSTKGAFKRIKRLASLHLGVSYLGKPCITPPCCTKPRQPTHLTVKGSSSNGMNMNVEHCMVLKWCKSVRNAPWGYQAKSIALNCIQAGPGTPPVKITSPKHSSIMWRAPSPPLSPPLMFSLRSEVKAETEVRTKRDKIRTEANITHEDIILTCKKKLLF